MVPEAHQCRQSRKLRRAKIFALSGLFGSKLSVERQRDTIVPLQSKESKFDDLLAAVGK